MLPNQELAKDFVTALIRADRISTPENIVNTYYEIIKLLEEKQAELKAESTKK